MRKTLKLALHTTDSIFKILFYILLTAILVFILLVSFEPFIIPMSLSLIFLIKKTRLFLLYYEFPPVP